MTYFNSIINLNFNLKKVFEKSVVKNSDSCCKDTQFLPNIYKQK